MDTLSQGKPPRAVDHTSRDARLVVSQVVGRLQPFRSQLAVIQARTQKSLSQSERSILASNCDGIANAIQIARRELAQNLAEAPAPVAAHSRVTDAERAICNLEILLNTARVDLEAHS